MCIFPDANLFLISLNFSFLKGKGSALGVGRGRAVAMRARVSIMSISLEYNLKHMFVYIRTIDELVVFLRFALDHLTYVGELTFKLSSI